MGWDRRFLTRSAALTRQLVYRKLMHALCSNGAIRPHGLRPRRPRCSENPWLTPVRALCRRRASRWTISVSNQNKSKRRKRNNPASGRYFEMNTFTSTSSKPSDRSSNNGCCSKAGYTARLERRLLRREELGLPRFSSVLILHRSSMVLPPMGSSSASFAA